jgi:regulatory protein
MKTPHPPLTNPRELYDRAIRLLTQKTRSRWELRRLLEKRCADDALVDAVLDKCVAQGYLDDVQYAIQMARTQAERKRHGRRRVAQELRARGIAADLIERTLAEVFSVIDESALLRRALEIKLKKTSGRLNGKTTKKIYDQLVRAGFNADLIFRELRRHRLSLPADHDPTAEEL